MQTSAVIVGALLVVAGAALLRWRTGIARWQLEMRSEEIRRRSLSGAEYVDRQTAALTTPDQHRLQRWIITAFAAFVVVCGAYAIARGLGA